MPYDRTNIFARILRGELPSRKVYEDQYALAFHDIYPRAAVHVLVIPKGEYVSLVDFTRDAPAETIVGFWRAVVEVARQLGVESGYRIAANQGSSGGQLVFHFHVHIVSGGRASGPRA